MYLGASVDIGGLDDVEELLGDARLVNVEQVRLEQRLGRLEALCAHLSRASSREQCTQRHRDRQRERERESREA
jgi:hypothetical protein